MLSKIKMSGFKSFVDPTTITLPSRLVAIVGPNGCGKSNIIDAVTWVMGESSPKYLRGESLTDVIFNGSTARKPVGQASVELVFDNTNGMIEGEYSSFNEISIKRVINRESDSVYYLNGVRCRKRDVVDIFLGTGLGPRSYSIIGQNMITRIIEAKPDEMRTYLEEAAGISKYKERRHETELRINHTKDNLVRVQDLHAELEKQLSHLKHQANVAEKYKSLKQQERVLRAELLGIQWRQLDSCMVDHTLKVQREETALEARNSELSKTNHEIEQLRHEQRVAQDAYQEVQRRYYAVGNEITRSEQDILHHQERQQQWENGLRQAENEHQEIKEEMAEAEDTLSELESEIESIGPQVTTNNHEFQVLQQELNKGEEASQKWQAQWDAFHQLSAKTAQTAQVEKVRVAHLEQKISSLQKRIMQLQQNKEQFNFSGLAKEIEEFAKKATDLEIELKSQNQELTDTRHEISSLHTTQQNANQQLDQIRNELQRLRLEQASLDALQQIALGQRDNRTVPWIQQQGLADQPRLAQLIEVEKGWELAVEKALGWALQAICVDQIGPMLAHLDQFKAGNLSLFATLNTTTPVGMPKGPRLIDKIKSSCSLDPLLSGIYIADSLEEALKICEGLQADESVMTREGAWLNRSWLKIHGEKDPTAGVFQRRKELKQLVSQIDSLQQSQTALEETIQMRQDQLQQLEQKQDQLQQLCHQLQTQFAQINAQHKVRQDRLAELTIQSEGFNQEQAECEDQLQQAEKEQIKAGSLWENALKELETQAKTREDLIKERDKARLQLQLMRDKVNKKREELYEQEMKLQTAKSQKASIKQTISRFQSQLASLNERKITFQSELSSMQPMEILKKSLSRVLDKHVSVERELNTARISMEALEQEFRSLEERRQIIERDITKIRGTLEQLRIELQGWKVKSDTLIEQMKETEFTLENILKDLPQHITTEDWQNKLEQVVQRINRLGPINLIAIDEYATCLERKEYLDKQIDDLQSGLATLAEAIEKIDRETRAKFKETFDQVNDRFQKLFPTVFGGGKAYIELTSDNLLEAGVTVMACPPGKRNSSIYLLSGGEKSLTAIALIFSIFYLNPAPFCLLDEVDAALDDTNVLRFTHLVKVMAEKSQFIFISHNKNTIEMAEHLIGVTMNEPGVSRLVSVDIEKAIRMAGSHIE